MNTTSKILLGSLLLALAVGMTTTTVAQVNDDATQSSTVDVGIASDTGLDVRPVSFSYTSVNPGSQTTSASSGVSAIEIENIGSENISDIWMGASKPDSDPFGTGIAAQYDAGNFIQVNTTGVDREPGGISPTDHPHYVSRVEYVEPAPTFLQLPDAGTVGSADSSLVGRFRAADEWWFYAIFYDSATQDGDNLCGSAQSGEDELVYIGKQAHDAGTTGTIDFTDTSNVEIYEIENISDSSAYGVLNETVTIDPSGSETRDYSMLTFCDSTNIDTDSHIQRDRREHGTDHYRCSIVPDVHFHSGRYAQTGPAFPDGHPHRSA